MRNNEAPMEQCTAPQRGSSMKPVAASLIGKPKAVRLLSAERMSDMLDYRLYMANRDCGYFLERLLQSRFGITRWRWRIIATVHELEGATLSDIAARAELDKAQASRTVGTMVREGYLKRLSNPDNARYAKVIFTDKGRALYEEILSEYRGANGLLLEVLAQDEIEMFDKVIDKIRDRAQHLASNQKGLLQLALPRVAEPHHLVLNCLAWPVAQSSLVSVEMN